MTTDTSSSAGSQIIRIGPSLSTIGIITGIVLCILQGVGTINIGWFWATFPFWIVPASIAALVIVAWIIVLIAAAIVSIKDHRKRR